MASQELFKELDLDLDLDIDLMSDDKIDFDENDLFELCNSVDNKVTNTTLIENSLVPLPRVYISPEVLPKLDELIDKHEKHLWHFDDFSQIMHLSYPYEVMSKFGDKPYECIINFSKDYCGFEALSEDDQLELIKEGFFDVFILNSVMSVDEDGVNWIQKDKKNQVTKWHIQQSFKFWFSSYFNQYSKLIKSGPKNWHLDSKLCLLLFGILLFNPDRKNLRNKAIVWRNQQFCYDLLHRYLDQTFKKKASLTFFAFIEILAKLRELGKGFRIEMTENPKMREWNLRQGSRLVLELFGLINT